MQREATFVKYATAIILSIITSIAFAIYPDQGIDIRSFPIYFLVSLLCYSIIIRQQVFPFSPHRSSKASAAISLVFAVITGFSVFFTEDKRAFYEFDILVFGIRLLGSFIFLFLLIKTIFQYADRHRNSLNEEKTTGSVRMQLGSHFFWICFAVILICWLPYFIKLFPCASIAWDSTTAWGLMHGLNRNTNNPFLATILFSAVLDCALTSGHFELVIHGYAILQALMFIGVISYSLAWMNGKKVPVWVLGGICLVVSLMPFIPAYAYSVEKDALFGLVFLLYVQLLMEWAFDHDVFSKSKTKLLAFIICHLLMPGLRNGMGGILLITALFILLAGLSGKERKKNSIIAVSCIVISVLSFIVLPQVTQQLYGGTVMPRESMSIPAQQIGYINKHVCSLDKCLTKDEINQLDSILDLDCLDNYDPLIADPIKECIKDYPSKDEMQSFWQIWEKLVKKYPMGAFKAWVLSSSAYYTPAVITDVKAHLVLGYQNIAVIDDSIQYRNQENSLELNSFDQKLINTPVIGLFERIGIYTWVLLVLVMYTISRRDWAGAICVFPVLVFMVACCFSPVNGYFRYAFPPIICTLILIPGVLFAFQGSYDKTERKDRGQK